jgi:hypothetical protein
MPPAAPEIRTARSAYAASAATDTGATTQDGARRIPAEISTEVSAAPATSASSSCPL